MFAKSRAPEDLSGLSEEQLEEEVPQQVSIGKRLGDWRTLLSFGIAAAILVFAVGKSLSATKRSRRVSRAFQTTPMPPAPNFSTTR